jgi:hypothetical protein
VIPTLLLVGLVFGRWWKVAIPASIVGWVAWLVVGDVGSGLRFVVAAGSLAAANVIVGVLAFQALRWIVRRTRSAGQTARRE